MFWIFQIDGLLLFFDYEKLNEYNWQVSVEVNNDSFTYYIWSNVRFTYYSKGLTLGLNYNNNYKLRNFKNKNVCRKNILYSYFPSFLYNVVMKLQNYN